MKDYKPRLIEEKDLPKREFSNLNWVNDWIRIHSDKANRHWRKQAKRESNIDWAKGFILGLGIGMSIIFILSII